MIFEKAKLCTNENLANSIDNVNCGHIMKSNIHFRPNIVNNDKIAPISAAFISRSRFTLWKWFIALLVLILLPGVKSDGFCGIIAATNIQAITGYSQWSCTTAGVTSTTPCNSPVWPGLTCSGGNPVSISFVNIGLAGM